MADAAPEPSDFLKLAVAAGECVRSFDRMRESFERFAAQISYAVERMDAYLWQPYWDAGSPYGRTYKGRERWYAEGIGDAAARATSAEEEARVWALALMPLADLIREREIP